MTLAFQLGGQKNIRSQGIHDSCDLIFVCARVHADLRSQGSARVHVALRSPRDVAPRGAPDLIWVTLL